MSASPKPRRCHPALAISFALAACAPRPAVPPPAVPAEAPPLVAATASPAADAPGPAPAPAPDTAVDPQAVRCGVDDSPVEIGGREDEPIAPQPLDRGALGVLFGRGAPIGFSAFPTVPTDPANAPLDPGVSTLTIDVVRRDGQALAEQTFPKGLLVMPLAGPRERVLPCALSRAQDMGKLSLSLQVSANGQPVTAIARAPELTAAQSRCLGQMACKLTLPAQERASTLVVEGKVAFRAPGFKGTVRAVTRRASRGRGSVDPAFAKLDHALTKIASACTRQTPPVASFAAEITLKPSGAGKLSAGSFPSADAAGAILGCVAEHLGEAPTVSMATLRDDLVTVVTVTPQ